MTPTVPYHAMTPEARRAAWASLRERQARRARRHGRTPRLWLLASVSSLTLGIVLAHFDIYIPAALALWTGVGLAGFTIIAFVRSLMGRLGGRHEDLLPPGL